MLVPRAELEEKRAHIAELSAQVGALVKQGAEICGLDRILFYAPATRGAWRYVWDDSRPWVYGGTMCYRKDYWERVPFADIDVGEDNLFVWSPQAKRIAVGPGHELFVGMIHGSNTSPKVTSDRRWTLVDAATVEQLIGEGAAA